MSLALDALVPIETVGDIDGLRAVWAPGVEAVVCGRDVPEFVSVWLKSMSPQDLPQGRYIVRPEDVAVCMAELFEAQGVFSSLARDWIIQDVSDLATTLSGLMSTDYLRLRVEVITDDACSKFHIDNVAARLICTYSGPGTQVCVSHASGEQELASSAPTGAPILLKGKLWPGDQCLTLIHRSPPIAGSGTVRFVIVLEGVSSSDRSAHAYDQMYGHPV